MSCDLFKFRLPDTDKGCTWPGLTWTVSDVSEDDTEYAAALVSARFQLQDADGNAVLTRTSATNGHMTLVTTANAWSVTVEPVTISITAGTYTYALETTDADGVVLPRMKGTLRVNPEPVV